MKSTYYSFQPPQVVFNAIQTLGRAVDDLVGSVLRTLTSSSEPRVWQTQDLSGQMFWNATDPVTGQSIKSVSADELRIWIEERYA